MVPVMSLLVPILVSGVIVFVASSLIHMLLGYHMADFRQFPSEDEAMAALQRFNIPPGDYMMPRPTTRQAARSEEFKAKWNKGPKLIATVMKPGFNMGASMLKWFIFCCIVSLFAGYVAGSVHAPGTKYLVIFRTVGTAAFMGYALGEWPAHIWYQRSLGTTLRQSLDGLIYGLLTAGVFGWLWPH